MPIGSCCYDCETTSALHCVTHCVCVDLCLVRHSVCVDVCLVRQSVCVDVCLVSHSLCVDVLGKRRWRRVTDVLGPGLPAHCVDALQ